MVNVGIYTIHRSYGFGISILWSRNNHLCRYMIRPYFLGGAVGIAGGVFLDFHEGTCFPCLPFKNPKDFFENMHTNHCTKSCLPWNIFNSLEQKDLYPPRKSSYITNLWRILVEFQGHFLFLFTPGARFSFKEAGLGESMINTALQTKPWKKWVHIYWGYTVYI